MNIKLDFKNNSFISFLVIFMYRTTHFLYIRRMSFMANILDKFWGIIRWFLNINSQISYKAIIGKSIRLPHKANGVVISRYAVIGDEVTVYHGVTIGINERKKNKYVNIGNKCFIGSGAKIINCKIGDNCSIGANAVAFRDVPNYTTVVSIQQIVNMN